VKWCVIACSSEEFSYSNLEPVCSVQVNGWNCWLALYCWHKLLSHGGLCTCLHMEVGRNHIDQASHHSIKSSLVQLLVTDRVTESRLPFKIGTLRTLLIEIKSYNQFSVIVINAPSIQFRQIPVNSSEVGFWNSACLIKFSIHGLYAMLVPCWFTEQKHPFGILLLDGIYWWYPNNWSYFRMLKIQLNVNYLVNINVCEVTNKPWLGINS